MATTPPSPPASRDPRDDAFIREVDEAYRQDEMKQFFQRYGRWLLLAVGTGLAGLGAWLWWQAEQVRRVEAKSEQFTAALDKIETGSTTEAAQGLAELSKSGNPSYRSLSAFAEAGIALNSGDAPKAAQLFKAVADDPKAAQPLRDSATMKYLRAEFDQLPPAEVLKRTEPFIAGDSPWFPIAGELAALAHVKAGAPDKAGPLFYRIAADERAPASLRARAEQMASALGQDVTKIAADREKAAADATRTEPQPEAAAQ
ncbi:tetratricopeptide repeat protein [Sandaracinobacter sp. RS1-74]|uniref:tetratricopeptide repeat protein n=1 Tax=Sandaracinobacteroides sayramensis TaxID=2913411 RepID=UPI001EDB5238|nr:tetratricopeptide repeat protein [Sandaracinobacteroides sayramensis]MCG2842489.1 tetratricopeptide repeat protein [Sandaracinobacteroides sayramensis]